MLATLPPNRCPNDQSILEQTLLTDTSPSQVILLTCTVQGCHYNELLHLERPEEETSPYPPLSQTSRGCGL